MSWRVQSLAACMRRRPCPFRAPSRHGRIGSAAERLQPSRAIRLTELVEVTKSQACSRNQAADETIAAAGNIDIVSRVAAETDEAASHIADSADQLSLQSSHLDAEVAQFLGRVRAA